MESRGWTFRAGLNIFNRFFSLLNVSAGYDDLGGAEVDEVTGGFEAEAGGSAGYYYGFGGEGEGWFWGVGDELAVEEGEEE